MSDKKKNFYGVLKGRCPGIYTQWTGSGGAEEQVKGHPGAVYRGFATRAEAEYYLRSGGKLAPVRQATIVEKTEKLFEDQLSGDEGSEAGKAAPIRSPKPSDYKRDLAAGKVVIFTDGASTGNPGPGGYGVVWLSGDLRKEMSGGFRCTTNNRMELLGVIRALQALESNALVVLYSDSRYVVDAVVKGWARRWRSRGWMRDNTNRAENADLWALLLDLLDRQPVEFRWVRGHADHPENERCDQLAVQAARQKNLPADAGYKGAC